MKQWVVDTWVIAQCCDASSDDCLLNCIAFLCNILNNGKIYIDAEGEIQKEYYNYIPSNIFVSKWWGKMIRNAGKIGMFSNKLNATNKIWLLDKLHFDNSDIKFVGVASKTRDKLLVSGDSDYNKDVCEYLYRALEIRVMRPEEAL